MRSDCCKRVFVNTTWFYRAVLCEIVDQLVDELNLVSGVPAIVEKVVETIFSRLAIQPDERANESRYVSGPLNGSIKVLLGIREPDD